MKGRAFRRGLAPACFHTCYGAVRSAIHRADVVIEKAEGVQVDALRKSQVGNVLEKTSRVPRATGGSPRRGGARE